MRNMALSIVLSSLLCLISIIASKPAAAGEYYDGYGYYGGHRHSYYRSESYDRPYYGPSYINRSTYYEPPIVIIGHTWMTMTAPVVYA